MIKTLSLGIALAIAISTPAWSQTQKGPACAPGTQKCFQWCKDNAASSQSEYNNCLFSGTQSCTRKHAGAGGVDACVPEKKKP